MKDINSNKEMTEDLGKKISSLQNHITELEDIVLKKKSKAKEIKTITVSSSTHSSIKKHCAKNGIKIGEWVEEILLKEINGPQ